MTTTLYMAYLVMVDKLAYISVAKINSFLLLKFTYQVLLRLILSKDKLISLKNLITNIWLMLSAKIFRLKLNCLKKLKPSGQSYSWNLQKEVNSLTIFPRKEDFLLKFVEVSLRCWSMPLIIWTQSGLLIEISSLKIFFSIRIISWKFQILDYQL